MLIFFVDDILLASSNHSLLRETKDFLNENFDMKDMGEADHSIGIEIYHNRSLGMLKLSQMSDLSYILKRFSIENCFSW